MASQLIRYSCHLGWGRPVSSFEIDPKRKDSVFKNSVFQLLFKNQSKDVELPAKKPRPSTSDRKSIQEKVAPEGPHHITNQVIEGLRACLVAQYRFIADMKLRSGTLFATHAAPSQWDVQSKTKSSH